MCTLNDRKSEFLIQQQCHNHCDLEKHVSHVTEDTIVEAYWTIEMNLQLQLEDLLRGFRSFFDTYTWYHLLTYVL
jgi:hypothetical protein